MVGVVLVRRTSVSDHGGSSASASAAKSLRALRLRLRWTTMSGYRLRRDGGGRRWIGRYGVEDGGGWGFAASGEGFFAPMEYEWGNGGRRGTKREQCFGLRRACLKFGESYKLCPHLKFQTYCRLGVGQHVRCPKCGRDRFRPSAWVGAHGV